MKKSYKGNENSEQITAQFHLTYLDEVYDFLITTGKTEMTVEEKSIPESSVEVTCEASDWLKVSSGRMNPVIEAIGGKIKFKGNTALLSSLSGGAPQLVTDIKDLPQKYETDPVRSWKKPEKVLIISASPRGSKGYTHLLCEEVHSAIKKTGTSCELVTLREKNIRECSDAGLAGLPLQVNVLLKNHPYLSNNIRYFTKIG